jgi:hypothetical protein
MDPSLRWEATPASSVDDETNGAMPHLQDVLAH